MSGLAYLIDALGGLAGGFAQNYNPVSNQADNDLGNAIAAIYGGSTGAGGGTGGSGPGGMGGGSYQYQGQSATDLPSAAPGGMGAGPLTQAQAPSQPRVAQGPAPGSPQGNAASGGNYGYSAPPQPQGGQGMPSPIGATNQSQGVPVAPQGQGASATIGRGGPLTLANLVSTIKRNKPHISDRELAAAVANPRAIALLNMEGRQQLQNLGLQLKSEQLQALQADRADRSADRKQGMRDRMQMSADRIQAQNERQQKDLEIKNQNIKIKIQALQQAKTLKEAQMNATALRSAIRDKLISAKQKLEATNHEIQMQWGLGDEQKAELYKQAQDDYAKSQEQAEQATKSLDAMLSEKEKGKTDSENTQATGKGAQGTAAPKVDLEAEKKNAQAAIKQMPNEADAIRKMYKERTGQDLGE